MTIYEFVPAVQNQSECLQIHSTCGIFLECTGQVGQDETGE